MCGRYSQTADPKTLQQRFGFAVGNVDLKPRYNIAPSQDAPVVINQVERRLEMFHWGLIPSWAKDRSIGYKMINARGETLLEKPSFKKPFQKARCLVLADGFYEWKKDVAGAKTPMRIVMRTRVPFAMAGLWESWRDPAGKEIKSFTIITTAACGMIKPIHDRMPVILRQDDEQLWLDPTADIGKLTGLLKPYPDSEIVPYAVSQLINSGSCRDTVGEESAGKQST